MGHVVDIAVHDSRGQLVLGVEIKAKASLASHWAAQERERIVASGHRVEGAYLLLATPARFYLWRPPGGPGDRGEPDYVIDPSPFLQPYYDSSGLSPEQLSHYAFEMMVSSWLSILLMARDADEVPADGQEWVVESGLFEAIRDGRLEYEAAA